MAAYQEQRPLIAMSSMQVLANASDVRAMVNLGILLGELGRSEKEVGVYHEVVARFGDAPEPALREQVAMALDLKEEVLANDVEEEIGR